MKIEKEVVVEALKQVIDPELGVNVIELGMIDEIFCINNSVHVAFSPTSRFCPVALNIGLEMKKKLQQLKDVKKVEIVIDNFIDSETVNELIKEA